MTGTTPPPPPARTRGGATGDVVAVLGVLALLGVLCGLLWWRLVTPAQFTKVAAGGSMGELELGKRFAGDGWYAVIAAVAGLPAGGALMWWRSSNVLRTIVLLAIGSVLAAATMAATGRLVGPPSPGGVLAHATVGVHVPVRLTVAAFTTYLVWPIAVLVGGLLVLWSSPTDPTDPTDGGLEEPDLDALTPQGTNP